MGFDLMGKASGKGEYFRNNCWWWRPLWNYTAEVCPDILTSKDHDSGHYNDGHLISAKKAEAIAARLHDLLTRGDVKRYSEAYNRRLAELADLPCKLCQGTGDRKDLWPPEWKKECGGCNACHGSGKVRPDDASYPFSEENVREFAEFAAASRGFEIL